MAEAANKLELSVRDVVETILNSIDKDREKEIISRRFGLFDRRETLEQIGELLGITRERVRQLEKSVLTRLKMNAEEGEYPKLLAAQDVLLNKLADLGNAARVIDLSARTTTDNSKIDQSQVAFIATLCPKLVVLEDNDFFYRAVATKQGHEKPDLKTQVSAMLEVIKKIGEPSYIEAIAEAAGSTDAKHVASVASISKQVATLNNRWGLIKWPMVNPKNIRDKIYVILHDHGKHMHFSEIANAIKDSSFKRKDVTVQAIHNELIKDSRFVLIGRGIYALKDWGYKKGTVADIITDVLKKAEEPLHRDEIVKRVLKNRYVKETTILLNLQGKPQFKRVSKATYALAE
jgi:hypothetical protein